VNQLAFTYTRARSTDPQTSRAAAKNAASGKAAKLRAEIQRILKVVGRPLTAREIADIADEDYYDVQRRLSETANIRKTGEVRDGAMVWEWVS
jgi:hypothetical protein